MAFNTDQDLPEELLKKLESLQIELEDGDITQKGYDKKRTNLLEQHSQKKKEEEEALLASLGPEPSAADVIDFLDYLPSPTHSPPRPTSGEQYMEHNHQLQQQQQQQQQPGQGYSDGSTGTISTTRTSSIGNQKGQNRYTGYDNYQQQVSPVQQQWQPQQQAPSYGQPPLPQVSYAPENTVISGQYYPATGSPRPNRSYDPRVARPQYVQPSPYYTSQPTSSIRPLPSTPIYQQQQQQQQRPIMPFPGSSYPQQQSTQQRPVYSNQPRPMYRPPMMNGGPPMQRPPGNTTSGGVYYRPNPNNPNPNNPPSTGYPLQGRSPTMDHQRAYGYTGGVSRSSTQNSSHGRYPS